jgi:hypothetical protein
MLNTKHILAVMNVTEGQEFSVAEIHIQYILDPRSVPLTMGLQKAIDLYRFALYCFLRVARWKEK